MDENNQQHNSPLLQQSTIEAQTDFTAKISERLDIGIRKPIGKVILSYLLRFYMTIIAVCVLVYVISFFAGTSGFIGDFPWLTTWKIVVLVAGVLVLIINSLFTFSFINKNVEKTDKEQINKIFVIKFCLVGALFSILMLIIQRIISPSPELEWSLDYPMYQSTWWFLSYLIYLLFPLFIPFSLFFLKKEILNRKTIYASIIALFILATVINTPIALDGLLKIGFIAALWFYIPFMVYSIVVFFLAFLPFLSISLVMIKIKYIDTHSISWLAESIILNTCSMLGIVLSIVAIINGLISTQSFIASFNFFIYAMITFISLLILKRVDFGRKLSVIFLCIAILISILIGMVPSFCLPGGCGYVNEPITPPLFIMIILVIFLSLSRIKRHFH